MKTDEYHYDKMLKQLDTSAIRLVYSAMQTAMIVAQHRPYAIKASRVENLASKNDVVRISKINNNDAKGFIVQRSNQWYTMAWSPSKSSPMTITISPGYLIIIGAGAVFAGMTGIVTGVLFLMYDNYRNNITYSTAQRHGPVIEPQFDSRLMNDDDILGHLESFTFDSDRLMALERLMKTRTLNSPVTDKVIATYIGAFTFDSTRLQALEVLVKYRSRLGATD